MAEDRRMSYSCPCGCGEGFELRNAFGKIYLGWHAGSWYAQQHVLRSAVRERIRYLREDRLAGGCVAGREDLERIAAFLRESEFDSAEAPDCPPYSFLEFGDCGSDDGEPLYEILLRGNLSVAGLLKGRYYRMFEAEAGEHTARAWLADIESLLSGAPDGDAAEGGDGA